MPAAEGQTALITGSTDGLGLRVAAELADRGARVLIHGRDEGRIERAVEETEAERGFLADLSSLVQIRRLAEEIGDAEERIDLLVNNAGIISLERRTSEDGFELCFAVNYLAGFALTGLLLPLLAPPARIVNVASIGQAAIDFDDVMAEREYDPTRAYNQSKLAQIMFTIELAPRLPEAVTVNALHPATLMDTKMVRESIGRTRDTVAEGAASLIHLATEPGLEGVSGRFFDRTDESAANPQAYDESARRKLWDLSEELTGVRY